MTYSFFVRPSHPFIDIRSPFHYTKRDNLLQNPISRIYTRFLFHPNREDSNRPPQFLFKINERHANHLECLSIQYNKGERYSRSRIFLLVISYHANSLLLLLAYPSLRIQ